MWVGGCVDVCVNVCVCVHPRKHTHTHTHIYTPTQLGEAALISTGGTLLFVDWAAMLASDAGR
jgi:hypothetical protein